MAELCLIASSACPPGLFHQEQGSTLKEFQPFVPIPGARQDFISSCCLHLGPPQLEGPWKPISWLSECNQSVKLDSIIRTPVLVDVQDTLPDSVLFSFGIAEKCTRHEKILQFLMAGSTEVERDGLDFSILSDLMGLQTMASYTQPLPPSDYGLCLYEVEGDEAQRSLIYPRMELNAQNSLLDFERDLERSSKITVHPDGRVLFTGTRAEMMDLLSIVADFYLSKSSIKWGKQSILVPHFTRLDCREPPANIHGSSLKLETVTVSPLKSPEKIKLKSSPKKKRSRKACRGRDLYGKNYSHACESLLSLIIDKRRGKTAILSLKKSSPEVPQLLTQFSAGIAGTGLAVLFSVVCKVACGRVPFCASKLLNTGFGLGLVWLSWALNRLRDTIVYISKNSSKMGFKEEEMMKRVDRSVNEIFFRAATLMAVAMLKLA
ncbi:hypothetical protein HHK36_032946 [Tetracentron sinense]|uniref:Uncharacterized protein n=1 Tax=Tetracentron sinense TaxID=13715 RepID=A0A834Y6H8_TETSI|nr:hypothetical protein HHK36_032946 [Tetracentron sinense]